MSVARTQARIRHGEYRLLPLEMIRPGRYQPRRHFDPAKLKDLAESIRAQGVVQPVIVRPDPECQGGYELIAGERRWRAARIAGCVDIPAVIRETRDASAAMQAIVENLQRENLDPIAEARGVRRLVDEFGLSHGDVAAHLGMSRSAVTHRLRLLRLPEHIQAALTEGVIEAGHARLLVTLSPVKRRAMFEKIVKKRWTIRQLEAALRASSEEPADTKRPPARDSSVSRLEEHLARHLGAPVKIDYSQGGDGHLTVRFFSLDEFDGLLRRLGWAEDDA